MEQNTFQNIVSGRRKDIPARAIRLLLFIASIPYAAAILLRNALYNFRVLKTHPVNAAVISVGNITTGGTGKTPLVAYLAKHISTSHKTAVLTRGYKSKRGLSDEPLLLSNACPGIEIVVNPDRVSAAREAIGRGAEVLILDDGFQHRRLGRDIDIVVIDATRPFGYERLLPAGLLREPLSSLKRAGAVVITRAGQVDEKQVERIKDRVKLINPAAVIAVSFHKPVSIQNKEAAESKPETIKEKKAFAFCGIGNPDAFIATLKSLRAEVCGARFFDDHYHYSKADIESIVAEAGSAGCEIVLTTEKDFSKINDQWLGESKIEIKCLTVEIEFTSGGDKITELIEKAIAGKIITSA